MYYYCLNIYCSNFFFLFFVCHVFRFMWSDRWRVSNLLFHTKTFPFSLLPSLSSLPNVLEYLVETFCSLSFKLWFYFLYPRYSCSIHLLWYYSKHSLIFYQGVMDCEMHFFLWVCLCVFILILLHLNSISDTLLIFHFQWASDYMTTLLPLILCHYINCIIIS
jgi:hypothetical protein